MEDPFNGSFGYYYEPPLTHQDDMAIKDAIEDERFRSHFVDLDDVQVHVTNGKATLTGTVDPLWIYRVAARDRIDPIVFMGGEERSRLFIRPIYLSHRIHGEAKMF